MELCSSTVGERKGGVCNDGTEIQGSIHYIHLEAIGEGIDRGIGGLLGVFHGERLEAVK